MDTVSCLHVHVYLLDLRLVCAGVYSAKHIKRSVHRYYESRRGLGIEELPDRQGKAAEQKRRRKHRARQQRSFDR